MSEHDKPWNSYGGWTLRMENLTVEIRGENFEYWVDLERCLNSAQVLDWICQVRNKTWATDDVLAGLARILNDVLVPQSTICGGGRGREIRKKDLRGKIVARLEWQERFGKDIPRSSGEPVGMERPWFE